MTGREKPTGREALNKAIEAKGVKITESREKVLDAAIEVIIEERGLLEDSIKEYIQGQFERLHNEKEELGKTCLVAIAYSAEMKKTIAAAKEVQEALSGAKEKVLPKQEEAAIQLFEKIMEVCIKRLGENATQNPEVAAEIVKSASYALWRLNGNESQSPALKAWNETRKRI